MTIDPRLAAVLHELFGIPAEGLDPAMELESELQLDSLSVEELRLALEEELGVALQPDPDRAVRTLGDLQELVDDAQRRGGLASGGWAS